MTFTKQELEYVAMCLQIAKRCDKDYINGLVEKIETMVGECYKDLASNGDGNAHHRTEPRWNPDYHCDKPICQHEPDGNIYCSNPPKNKCKKCEEYY